jgi:DNA recombination protein RmuC
MVETLPMVSFVLLGVVILLLLLLLVRLYRSQGTSTVDLQLSALKENFDRFERVLREEVSRNREETSRTSKDGREELSKSLTSFADSFAKQLTTLTQSNDQKLERMRETVEARLQLLQDDNSLKLEKMRETVDEKLHTTLERRLGESFKLVSDRLVAVQEGLVEMKALAADVGGLKKVLGNIKTRGTWGEIQLGNLLEQILTQEQYSTNVATKRGSGERVEFAIKLPGRDGEEGSVVWLPIDAKFPQEDYQRLLEAQDQANPAMVEEASKMLENRVKNEAKTIREKYLDPPNTTDFGIMYLPTEGLFAEVLRRPGLVDVLQREYRVSVTGPTTLLALLNSLQMGFRTLAIAKRSSEVWSLLGAVKAEFGKFGEILDKTQKKIQEASNTIESAATRSRAIERKLKDVQQLPPKDAANLLGPAESRELPEDPPEL